MSCVFVGIDDLFQTVVTCGVYLHVVARMKILMRDCYQLQD